jgi:uncharacterized protein involved in outer membrane biogenesis
VTRRSVVKIAALVIGVPLLLLAIVVLYLTFADLSGWRDTLASVVSDAIGRELKINGEFQAEIGFTTRVNASNITLANPAWSDDPHMVSVDHLAGEVDLLSFLFGPITIHDVEITGGRVLFEVDTEGRFNWALGSGKPGDGSGGEFELVISHAVVNDLRLAYAPPGGQTLQAELGHLEFTDDGRGMLDLDLEGSLEGTAIEISGRLGTFIGLINADRVEHDLTGRFADAAFGLRGKIGDLGSLTGVEGVASASGPALEQITAILGLDSDLKGPFSVEVSAKPSASGSDIDLEASAGGLVARMTGVVDSLTKPGLLDATVTASGPSVRTVGAITGVADLPDEEFSVSGGVRWQGFPVTFKQVEITVGDNALSADGVLGAPPQMLGTDFTIRGQGPHASSLGALAGIDLPREGYSVKGRLVRVEGGLAVEAAELRVGRTVIRVDGTVSDSPSHAGTTLSIYAEGPDLALFDGLVGAQLPGQAFVIDGRLAKGEQALKLDSINARVGSTKLRADGTVEMVKGLVGTTVQVDAEGSDATDLRALAGLRDLPGEAWTARGGVTILDSGLRLDGVSAAVGSLEAHGDGRLSTSKGFIGTDLQLRGRDPDLSHGISIFGVKGFPRVAATVEGRLRVEAGGYRLDGATGTAGDIDVAVDGLIGRPDLDGTVGHVSVHGPRLSSLGPYFRLDGLPPASFSVTGDVRVDGGACALEGLVAEIDRNRVTINGTVMPVKGLLGTDLQIELTAPDLGQVGRLAAGLTKLPDLPAAPLTLAARLHIDDAGYEIDGLHATLDQAVARVDGRVGPASDLVGTNLTITADGPSASLFSAFTGVKVPVEPFKVSGGIERTEDLFIFDRVAVRFGGYSIDLHGSLGEKPHLVGTDLDLHLSGPGTGLIAELTGYDKLPDVPFAIGGAFHGTPEKFTTKNLEITLGESDLEGSLGVDIRGKPRVTARFASNHLVLGELAPRPTSRDDQGPALQTATHSSKAGLVFSEKPIDFGWLQRADGDVDITVGTLQLPIERLHDFELEARLVDGRLDISRIAMVGSRDGNGSGSLVLEPVGDGYRVELALRLNAIRFDLPGEGATDAATRPPLDFDVRLKAQGASPHELASSSNGSIRIVVGKGVMDNRTLDLISADILLTLFKAFNPFAKEDVATQLQCAIALLTFEDGLAKLDPMVMQSNKMTMLGNGKIDLGTEKLNLEWVTKPRKGIGISASMITNPYIKLGGTLAKPAIELKPMEAMASTGVAVATMGISLVAKGMLDRVTAEKKVCKEALEEIENRTKIPPD